MNTLTLLDLVKNWEKLLLPTRFHVKSSLSRPRLVETTTMTEVRALLIAVMVVDRD